MSETFLGQKLCHRVKSSLNPLCTFLAGFISKLVKNIMSIFKHGQIRETFLDVRVEKSIKVVSECSKSFLVLFSERPFGNLLLIFENSNHRLYMVAQKKLMRVKG